MLLEHDEYGEGVAKSGGKCRGGQWHLEVDHLDMQRGLVSVVQLCLGAERAKNLITICTNSRTHSVECDFAVTLKVVEVELE